MSKEEKNAKKLAKKEAKLAKKEAKAAKANAKYAAKQEKKHEKAYNSFVKETEKKNAKLQAKDGNNFTPIAIPSIDEFQSKAELKAAKATQKAYAKYVKKVEKKNAKAEKKCSKKGKPYVPIAIPTEEEFASTQGGENKTKQTILTIILLLLIWFLIYFIVMYIGYQYVAPINGEEEPTAPGVAAEYESYSNPHLITTTPTNYDIADAKKLLKQTIHDSYKNMGYSSDPSSSAISFNNRIETVNSADCYMFSCAGKTFAVATNLSAVYYAHDGEYTPFSFNNVEILFD